MCGHEQGLLILWRGERRFKAQPKVQNAQSAGILSQSDVMVIDSDDKDSFQAPQSVPSFEEGEEEYDPSEPICPIIQTLDLLTGIEILHISFPNLPPKLDHTSMRSLPSLLSNNIVLALGCSDGNIRVLTLPLMPPSPYKKTISKTRGEDMFKAAEIGKYEEQIIDLFGHRSPPRGVCITVTARTSHTVESNSSIASQTREYDGKDSQYQSHSQGDGWEFLIASHSADLSGILLIHRVPIIENGTKIDRNPNYVHPHQTHQLSSPANCISFNIPLFPALQHLELLIAEAKGIIRILSCAEQHESNSEGLWLLSLHSAFQNSSDTPMRRKSIINAQWCLNGEAILVLHTDGEWGIWDIESTVSNAKKLPATDEFSSTSPLTELSLSSWIRSPVSSSSSGKPSDEKSIKPMGLAPMTPGTRKSRQEALFAGSIAQPKHRNRGGISVYPMFDELNNRIIDELALLWYNDITVEITGLRAYLQNKARKTGNLFGKEAHTRTNQVNIADLKGETLNEICLMPLLSNFHHASIMAAQREILVTGEHRISIISSPTIKPQMQAFQNLHRPSPLDQPLLAAGELDIDDMNMVLTNMSNGIETHYGH